MPILWRFCIVSCYKNEPETQDAKLNSKRNIWHWLRFARYPEASLAGGWDLVSPILTLSHFFQLQTLIWMSSGGSKFRNVSILLILSIINSRCHHSIRKMISAFHVTPRGQSYWKLGFVLSCFCLDTQHNLTPDWQDTQRPVLLEAGIWSTSILTLSHFSSYRP